MRSLPHATPQGGWEGGKARQRILSPPQVACLGAPRTSQGGRKCIPSLTASVATNTLSSWWVFIRLRIVLTAPSRLGTSSLCPQMKSFLLRWTPRYGPPREEPSLTWQRGQGLMSWTHGRPGWHSDAVG